VANNQRRRYEQETAVLAQTIRGGAFFVGFCGANDISAIRIGNATAVSTFHKPAEFRWFCNDNDFSSGCG
jgi:hypothetical protein